MEAVGTPGGGCGTPFFSLTREACIQIPVLSKGPVLARARD